ncbi:MAG TPA: aminomethyltransferase family protein [Candidatus Polarisedimenticolia bacterium]|nr:aminomethyltransferase family protein [Candidatus Polarisedimenticolia bacterium]
MPPSSPSDPLPRSPLHAVQRRGTLAFGEVDGWEMPRVFENVKREYLAAKGTVGVMDRSNAGRLRMAGARRLDLLHRITTNDLKGMAPGQGARTALLTDKGRVVDDLRVHAREGDLLVLTSPGNAGEVKARVEALRFRDDVTVEEITSSTAMIALYGPQSGHLLDAAAHAHGKAPLDLHHSVELAIAGRPVLAARTGDVGGAGYNLVVSTADGPAVWEALLQEGGPYGASPLGEEAYEMLRIERGVPRFGREISQEHNPLEIRLDDAISWTKGCYIGQEVVARLDSRRKVSKLLVGLWLEPGPVPEAGSPIEDRAKPGQPVGRLTSVAPSLDFRRVIGLGIVRSELAAPGTVVSVASAEDRVEAVVSDLPFAPPGPS